MRILIHPEDAVAAAHGIHRSPEWPRVERIHLSMQPKCVCCSEEMSPGASVQVHHIFPFHYAVALGRPDLELDQRNLITLCEDDVRGQNHHLLVGHLDSFRSSNLDVISGAATTFHGLTAQMIRNSTAWKQLVAKRLAPLAAMSPECRAAFLALMNVRFPKLG